MKGCYRVVNKVVCTLSSARGTLFVSIYVDVVSSCSKGSTTSCCLAMATIIVTAATAAGFRVKTCAIAGAAVRGTYECNVKKCVL